MSKKITSYEELLKKGKECEEKIDVRKKWTNACGEADIEIRVGISSPDLEAKKLADELGIAIIEKIKEDQIENVVVYQTEFYGYEGDKPSLEIIIPGKGQVVFGNLDVQGALEILDRYLMNTEFIENFLVDNDGNKICNH